MMPLGLTGNNQEVAVETSLSNQDAWMVLNALPGIGPMTVQKLLKELSISPLALLKVEQKDLSGIRGLRKDVYQKLSNWPTFFDLEVEKTHIKRLKGNFIEYSNPSYPELLKAIADAPMGLYCLGDSNVLNKPTIAIVGSRRSTLYGQKMAKKLALDLAQRGFVIASGMARGIDTASHEGALEGGGKTVAVLGCGANVVYPPENRQLYERIQQNGAVISEFKLGTQGDRYTFPMRNRIISGLAHAVIVIETDAQGGSMITARMAAEQGRHVFALPGRVDQPCSRGCHLLIRDGATLIQHAQDILDELSYLEQLPLPMQVTPPPACPNPLGSLSQDQQALFNLVKMHGPIRPEAITQELSLDISEVQATLMLLEIRKFIIKRADGAYEHK